MPERSVVRELVTLLGFDVDDKTIALYTQRIREVKKRMRDLTIATGIFAGAVAYATRQLVLEGKTLSTMSDRLRISTDALQEWQFAAKQAEVPVTTLNASLDSFVRRVGMAARGMGPARDALARLRIQIRDGNGQIRDMDTLLMDSFQALQDWGAGAEQAELAGALFNMSGAHLTQMLADGTDGLIRMRRRAHELGIIMDEDLIQSSKEANEAWNEFVAILKSVRNAMAVDFLPALGRTLRSWGEWVAVNKQLAAWLGKVVVTVLALNVALKATLVLIALVGFLLTPIVLKVGIIIAGIAMLVLLAQDIAMFLTGKGPTVTGKAMEAVRTAIDLIRKWIADFQDELTDWILVNLPADVITALTEAKDWLWDQARKWFAFVEESLKRVVPGVAPKSGGSLLELLIPAIGLRRLLPESLSQMGRQAETLGSAGAGGPTTINVTINQSPGQTPEAVGEAVMSKLAGQRVLLNGSTLARLAPA